MRNTSEIRKANHFHILQMLADGKEYTVAEMSSLTGLCAATCNTILREMAQKGEALAEKRQMNEVGRASVIYRLNAEYRSILYVFPGEGGTLVVYVAYYYGGQRSYESFPCERYDYDTVSFRVKRALEKYSNIDGVYVAVPRGVSAAEWRVRLESECTASVHAAYADEYALGGYLDKEGVGGKEFLLVREQENKNYAISLYINGKAVGGNACPAEFSPSEAERAVAVMNRALRPDAILLSGNKEAFSSLPVREIRDFDGYLLNGMTVCSLQKK